MSIRTNTKRSVSRLAVGFGAVAVVSMLDSAAAGGNPPSIFDPNPGAVVQVDVARTIFHLADTRRVEFALIGDSNARSQIVSGHEDGMLRALSERFGNYATRVDPVLGNGGWGALVGGVAPFLPSPFAIGYPDKTPVYAFPVDFFPVFPAYLPASQTAPPDFNGGLVVSYDSPIGLEDRLIYHLTHRTFRTPTDGLMNLSVREAYPGNGAHNYAFRSSVSTAAVTPGLRDEALEIPAGTRAPSGITCGLTDFGHYIGARGPILALWQRVENPGRVTGIAYHTLLRQGGLSARAACEQLNGLAPDAPAMQEWLRQVTRLQNAPGGARDGVLVVHIMHGGNDNGDVHPSLGPTGGLESLTPEGHKDNLRGIMRDMRAFWAAAGNNPANLFFVLGPYHPLNDRIDTQRQYEDKWVELTQENPNTMAIRGTMLTTEAEMFAAGYFNTETDHAHMSIEGYRAWGHAAMTAVQRAICPADMNDDRVYSVQDVFMFLDLWFAQTGRGDFNRDGAFEIGDLFGFLNAYFVGC